jgi:hypothetical protein
VTKARRELDQTLATAAAIREQRSSADAAASEAQRRRAHAQDASSDAARRTAGTELAAQMPDAPRAAAPRTEPARSAAPRAAALAFSGRNGRAEVDLAVPERARITEGVHNRSVVQLVVDGVAPDALPDSLRDVTRFGSPVRNLTTYRDPAVANRVIVRAELLAPCSSSLRRTPGGVHWQLDEEAVW